MPRTNTLNAPRTPAVAIAVVVTAALMAAAPAAAQEPAFHFQELAPGVVAAVVNPDAPSYAFANSLIVIGADGVLVVDTQQSPRPAREVLAEIRRRTDAPVRWVVNTHWHADHVWGNQVYADSCPDVEFLATPATRDTLLAAWPRQAQQQREHTLETRGQLQEMLESETDPDRADRIRAAIQVRNRYLADLDRLRIILPDRLVEDRLRIDLGGRTAVLVAVGPAHTPGDLVVRLPDTGIIAMGDIIEEGDLWLEGADPAGWVRALNTVLAMDPRILVPGHGAVQTDLELIRAQREQLRALAGEGGR